ncbi:MAG: site-specific DNA-methyltransferase [Firmicutes bacterium]|nr:site-specific DNA-methyltransferase [Bacillota bacterium]
MDELERRMMNTPDLNKERLARLKELFPDLFTAEGKLNPDELKKIVDPELVKETERFEFKWFGKSEAKRLAFTPSKATLVYDEKRSVNPELADGNLIIEGENLETLKVLLAGYRERIKCIYIDPPYNTGNDFVYSDNWDESKEDYWEHIGVANHGIKLDTNTETNGRYHSKWLSMMYPRLLLARQLLKDDGVIFISIDDNEAHHLRKLCDEVFGEENFRNAIIIRRGIKNVQAQFETIDRLNYGCEYLLLYSKNPDYRFDQFEIELDNGKEGSWNNHWRGTDRPTMRYNLFGITPDTGQWRWGKERSERAIENYNNLLKSMGKDESTVKQEDIDLWFMKNVEETGEEIDLLRLSRNGKPEHYIPPTETKLASNLWTDLKPNGNNQLKLIFKEKCFDNPKSLDLIKRLIKFSEGKMSNSIILDFFAGSGTTAQAVMELNREDRGNRKFILVQLPEFTAEKSEAYKAGFKKISDITIERNKRVIERMEKEESEKNPVLFNQDQKPFKTGFKVYKLAKSNFPRVEFAPDPTKTEEENLALLDKYIQEKEAMYLAMLDEKNIFDEVLLKNGFMLNYTLEKMDGFSKNKVFFARDDYKECLICMEMGIEKATLKELEGHKDKIFICLERALDTTMKWNLKHLLGDKLAAF